MSDSDCVILSGARKEEKYLGDCLNRTTYMLRKQELFVEISVLNISQFVSLLIDIYISVQEKIAVTVRIISPTRSDGY